MNMKHLYLIITLLLLLPSCKESNKERITRLVNEWEGKEIIFPKNPIFTRYATDTLDYKIPKSKYKVLIYVDSVGCTSCKLQLPKWKELIAYTDSLTGKQIPYLFFFQSKDKKELQYILRRDRFDTPVCIDRNDGLNRLNKFPSELMFQTFLLDEDNKVTVIGNPIHNPLVKDMYLKLLTGKSSPAFNVASTTAEVINDHINFGMFHKSESKTTIIGIRNTGKAPLIIVDVNTSCGCTTVRYDKTPAQPGDTLKIQIKMTPEETGFFNKTVAVRCNTNRPIVITITGNVLQRTEGGIKNT